MNDPNEKTVSTSELVHPNNDGSEDGEHLWFLLGTHNFYKAKPDEEVELVPCDVSWLSAAFIEDVRRRHADTIAKGPSPLVACTACRGSGKVAQKGNPFA